MKVKAKPQENQDSWLAQLDNKANDYRGITAILITAGSAYTIYKNPKNLMVFCSAGGATLGSFAAWALDASWTKQIGSAIMGASFGALSARFFPERAGKVHQAVMGYFGFTFEASKESSEEAVLGDAKPPVEQTADRVDEVLTQNNETSTTVGDTDATVGETKAPRTFEFINENGESSQVSGAVDQLQEVGA